MRALLLALLFLPAAGSSLAGSFRLQPDGGGDFPALQTAFEVLSGGEPDTLWLADGVFTGPGNWELYAVDFAGLIASASADPGRCTLDFAGHEIGQAFGGALHFVDLRFTRQTNELRAYGAALSFTRCVFEDGGSIASSPDEWSPIVLSNCTTRRLAASAISSVGLIRIEACRFEENLSPYSLISGYDIECRESRFVGNVAGGSLLRVIGSDELPGKLIVADCAFLGNAAGACVELRDAGTGSVRDCSFAGNGGPLSADIRDGEDFGTHSLAIASSIFAFREDGVVLQRGGSSSPVSIACCDVFGNAGGDWVGDLAPFGGINGNLAADPLFCDWLAGDLTLFDTSPCLPANNACGVLIGAEGQGCTDPTAAPAAPGGGLRLAALPNPFNPKARFVFSLPAASAVQLAVFDAAGRRVATLLDGAPRPAGEQAIAWDARGLASGVYLARLEAAGRRQEIKLTLLR